MNRLKELRIDRGMTMKEVADALSLPYTTYVNYEKGTRYPTPQMLVKMASFFGTSVDYLLDNKEISNNGELFGLIHDLGKYNPAFQMIIKKYCVLDAYGKDVVDVVLDKEYKRVKEQKKLVEIPLVARSGDNETFIMTKSQLEEVGKIIKECEDTPDNNDL